MSKLADMAASIQKLHNAAAVDGVTNRLTRQFSSAVPTEPESMPALEQVQGELAAKSRVGHLSD